MDAETGEKVDAPITRLCLEINANTRTEVQIEMYIEGWVIEGVPVWKMDVDQLREVALNMGFNLAPIDTTDEVRRLASAGRPLI